MQCSLYQGVGCLSFIYKPKKHYKTGEICPFRTNSNMYPENQAER